MNESQGSSRPVGDVTTLLREWSAGKTGSQEKLFELIYPKLHKIAQQSLHREPNNLLLQATELVSEAYLRLVDQQVTNWQNRAHFFALAATCLRRILVDHAKHRRRAKRGGTAVHLNLESVEVGLDPISVDVLALDLALTELAVVQTTTARIVELRYFAGLSLDDAARTLGLGRSTVVRRWRFAKAWLANRLIAPSR